MVEDGPTHLIANSIVRDDPILSIDRRGVVGFWSKILWMKFFQGTSCETYALERIVKFRRIWILFYP